MGGWVGFGLGWIEEKQAVGMSSAICSIGDGLVVCRWVDGWGESFASSFGSVGGWVDG